MSKNFNIYLPETWLDADDDIFYINEKTINNPVTDKPFTQFEFASLINDTYTKAYNGENVTVSQEEFIAAIDRIVDYLGNL